jgi:hypothetical protein
VVLDIYMPHAIHRNFIADVGLMTPKQVARSLVSYSQKDPSVHMTAFVIRQVPGTIPRSHPVDGVAESLVKSKKYLIPLTILAPEVTGGVVVAYLADGRLKLPKGTPVFNIGDEETTDRRPRIQSRRRWPLQPEVLDDDGVTVWFWHRIKSSVGTCLGWIWRFDQWPMCRTLEIAVTF